MIDKQSVRSLIENTKEQQKKCREAIEDYKDDPDQVTAFETRIKHYEFMIGRLQYFL